MDTKVWMQLEGKTDLSFALCYNVVKWSESILLPNVRSNKSWSSMKSNDLVKVINGIDVDALKNFVILGNSSEMNG